MRLDTRPYHAAGDGRSAAFACQQQWSSDRPATALCASMQQLGGSGPYASPMLTPEAEELRRSLIADATNDVIGVYEALWDANTRWPERPPSERLRIAEEAVRSALDEGLLIVEVGSWQDGTTPVDDAEARTLLNEWATWAIPDGPKVFVWRTDKGIEHARRASA